MKNLNEFQVVTSVVITDRRGNVLLGKRSMQEDVFPGLWSIPGGKCESGQECIEFLEKNAKREVKEEFGVDVHITDYLESHYNGEKKVYVTLIGRIANGIPRPLEDTYEVRWFSLEEALKLELCPEVGRILELAIKHRKG